MNTPDTEVEKAELAVFWDEIAQHLPKSIERSALGDEKIFRAFATAYPKMKKHLLTSRNTYWKERVRKNVGVYANQKFLEGTIVDPLELYEAITNEDNLK